jgi:hypothetical protein
MSARRCIAASIVASLFLLVPALVSAHGPFDNSARLIVHDDSLELTITVGAKAAEQLFKDVPEMLQQRGPRGENPLPLSFSSRLGKLMVGLTELSPERISVHPEELETAITLVYVRPEANQATFIPTYISGIRELEPGVMEITDENGNRLGASELSRGAKPIELTLPAKPGTGNTTETGIVTATDSKAAPVAVEQPVPEQTLASRKLNPMWIVPAVVLLSVIWLISRSRRSVDS